MAHAPLLVERRHRLRAQILAAARAHRLDRHSSRPPGGSPPRPSRRPGSPRRRCGRPRADGKDRPRASPSAPARAAPPSRRRARRQFPPARAPPRRCRKRPSLRPTMPADRPRRRCASAPAPRRRGTPRSRRDARARRCAPRSAPRRAPAARAASPRSARRSCVRNAGARFCVVDRARPRRHRVGIGEEPLHQRDRPRRRRHHLPRPRAEPQPELQHVPCRLGVAPLRQLVAPGDVELRSAQALRIFRRERQRHRAVRQLQPPLRADPLRLSAPSPVEAQEPGGAVDHHLAHVGDRLADQRDAPGRRVAPSPCVPSTRALTHSAPARVLPAPRPPSISHVVQSPSGGSWSGRAAFLVQSREIRPLLRRASSLQDAPNLSSRSLRRASLRSISASSQAGSSRKSYPASCFFVSRAFAAFSFRFDRILISSARQSSVSVRAFASVMPSSASRFSSMATPTTRSLFNFSCSASAPAGTRRGSFPGFGDRRARRPSFRDPPRARVVHREPEALADRTGRSRSTAHRPAAPRPNRRRRAALRVPSPPSPAPRALPPPLCASRAHSHLPRLPGDLSAEARQARTEAHRAKPGLPGEAL